MDNFSVELLEPLVDLLVSLESRSDFVPTENELKLIDFIKSNLEENYDVYIASEIKIRSAVNDLKDFLYEEDGTISINEHNFLLKKEALLKKLKEIITKIEN